MKWNKDAKEGIVVAGGQGEGNATTQVSLPQGLVVDTLGTIYVADTANDRVMRWPQGAIQGTVIAGGNGQGAGANQFNGLEDLSFDRHGNLYVADVRNNRVQRFSIE
jgi:sugar lactone lactonase YvrE